MNIELPKDFDAEIYLELHPDVKAAGVDPAEHYLEFGVKEKRAYKKSSDLLSKELAKYDSNSPENIN